MLLSLIRSYSTGDVGDRKALMSLIAINLRYKLRGRRTIETILYRFHLRHFMAVKLAFFGRSF